MTIYSRDAHDFEIENFPSMKQRIRFKTNRAIGPRGTIFKMQIAGFEYDYVVTHRFQTPTKQLSLHPARYRYSVEARAKDDGYQPAFLVIEDKHVQGFKAADVFNARRQSMIDVTSFNDSYNQYRVSPLVGFDDIKMTLVEHHGKAVEAWGSNKPVEFRLGGFLFRGLITQLDCEAPVDSIVTTKITVRITRPVKELPFNIGTLKGDLSGLSEEILREAQDALKRNVEQWYRRQFYARPAVRPSYVTAAEVREYFLQTANRLPPSHPMCRSTLTGKDCSVLIIDDPTEGQKEPKVDPKKLDRNLLKANRFYVGSRLALGLPESIQGRRFAPAKPWGHKDVKGAVAHAEELLEASDGEEQFIVKIVKVVRRKPQPVIVEDVK